MAADAQLVDRFEVADLFAQLARVLDESRAEEAHLVYTDDVVVVSPRGGELRGLEAVIAHLRRSQVDGERTHHVHGDVLVHIDGDRAEASASQLAYFYRDGESPHQISGLRLAYQAVRTPTGWRFDQAQLTLAWTQNN